MPYSIRTKDGIVINNIPDNVARDSDELKTRVAGLRAQKTESAPTVDPTQAAVQSGELPALPGEQGPNRPPGRDPSLVARRPVTDVIRRVAAPIRTAVSGLVGAADLGLSMATGMAGQAVGGIGGLNDLGQGPAKAAETVDNISRFFTYSPRTQAGQALAQGIATPMARLDKEMQDSAEYWGGGDPLLSTIAYTAMNAVPTGRGAIGAPGRVTRNLVARQAAASAEAVWLEQGIRLGSYKMKDQISGAVQRAATDVPRARGEAIATLGDDVKAAAQRMQQAEDLMYATARGTPAYINSSNLQGVQYAIDNILKDFPPDISGSGRVDFVRRRVQGLIGDPKAINMNAQQSLVSMNELDQLRRQIKNGLPQAQNFTGTDKALLQIKGQLDAFINRQFETGLIHGDQAALEHWTRAREITRTYRENFEENSAIYSLATDHKANPEDFRKYIFGLSQTGAKTESAQVIQRLKDIFGDNSPQLNAIRSEFLMDALDPLRGPDVDLPKFVAYYDKIHRNNPTLIKELSPFVDSGLEELATLARAAIKTGDASGVTFRIPTMIARFTVGHQIARKGALVGASAQVLEAIFGRPPRVVRREMLSELFGMRIDEPIFKPNTVELQGVWGAALNEAFTREHSDPSFTGLSDDKDE